MSEPKNHHYVPEVYLKSFSYDEHGSMYSFSIKSKYKNVKIKSVNKSQVCYEKHMYKIKTVKTIKELELSDPNFIEKNLFDYESCFLAKLIDKFTNRENVNMDDARGVIDLIVSFRLRNKTMKDKLTDDSNIKEIIDKEIEEFIATDIETRKKLSEEDFNLLIYLLRERFTRESAIEDNKSDMYNRALKTALEDKTKNKFYHSWVDLKFIVFYTDDQSPFITNDNPGFSKNKDGSIASTFTAETEAFIFPLSPKLCFVLSPNFKEGFTRILKNVIYREANEKFVSMVNHGVAKSSNRWIFSNSKKLLENLREQFN